MRRLGCVAAAASLAALLMSGCGQSAQHGGNLPGNPSTRPSIVRAQGDDRLPSETAADWVTYADYIAVVHPTSEHEMKPTRSETELGEGAVLRDLVMTVDNILWSSPHAAKQAPATFHWLAFGYAFSDGRPDIHVLMIAAGEPRLQVGHTYILALSWQPARCTDGDRDLAAWRGLGSGSVLPFDNGVVGHGEFEGRDIEPDAYASSVPAGSLASLLTGKAAADVTAALRAAKVEPKVDYLPGPAPCN